mgnify:CR=1 FL=1
MNDFITELIQRPGSLLLGAGSTISYKGLSNIQINHDLIDPTQIILHHDPMWHYLIIGVLGALGGLIFKIVWHLLKRKYPKLKNLVDEKNTD